MEYKTSILSNSVDVDKQELHAQEANIVNWIAEENSIKQRKELYKNYVQKASDILQATDLNKLDIRSPFYSVRHQIGSYHNTFTDIIKGNMRFIPTTDSLEILYKIIKGEIKPSSVEDYCGLTDSNVLNLFIELITSNKLIPTSVSKPSGKDKDYCIVGITESGVGFVLLQVSIGEMCIRLGESGLRIFKIGSVQDNYIKIISEFVDFARVSR